MKKHWTIIKICVLKQLKDIPIHKLSENFVCTENEKGKIMVLQTNSDEKCSFSS